MQTPHRTSNSNTVRPLILWPHCVSVATKDAVYAVPTEDSVISSLDPATGLPYERPVDEPDAYSTLPDANTNADSTAHTQGYDSELTEAGHYSQGYDGELTDAGHYSQGYDGELAAADGAYAAGYDGQLTDSDYALLRSRADRSTQRRPAHASTMSNAIYGATEHGAALPVARTMPNAVYAIPVATDSRGDVYAAQGELQHGGTEAPTYGAVHGFQNQSRAAATTHVVDDVAYVTAPSHGGDDDGEAPDYSTADAATRARAIDSAARTGEADGGIYADLYAQGAVNTYAQNNYIRVSAEDAPDAHNRLAGVSTGYVGDGTAPNPTGNSGYVDDSSRYDPMVCCCAVERGHELWSGNNQCEYACLHCDMHTAHFKQIYYPTSRKRSLRRTISTDDVCLPCSTASCA